MLRFRYDSEADILYIDTVPPYDAQESEELGNDVIARANPATGEIENLEVLFPAAGSGFTLSNPEDWETLVDWLEAIQDIRLAKEALEQLRAAGGDRQAAGWLKWEEVRETIV